MKTSQLISGIVCLCLIIDAHTAYARLYRWVDDQGEVHFGTQPPTKPVQSLEVKDQGIWRPYKQETGTSSTSEIPQGVTKSTVEFVKRGNLMIFDVRLNNKMNVNLMMDTGASYIVISPAIAKQIGAAINPKTPLVDIATANGIIKVALVNLDVVSLGNIETSNVIAAVHEMEGAEWENDLKVEGVLGMSFLKRFKLSVDDPRRRVTLEALYPAERYTAMNCLQAMEWFSEGNLAGKDLKKAVEYYEKAVLLCDDLHEAYYELADIYYVQKNYVRGVQIFKQAVQQYPDNAEAHYLLGVFYALDDKFLQAKNEFRQTLQLHPHHKGAEEWLDKMSGKAFQRQAE